MGGVKMSGCSGTFGAGGGTTGSLLRNSGSGGTTTNGEVGVTGGTTTGTVLIT